MFFLRLLVSMCCGAFPQCRSVNPASNWSHKHVIKKVILGFPCHTFGWFTSHCHCSMVFTFHCYFISGHKRSWRLRSRRHERYQIHSLTQPSGDPRKFFVQEFLALYFIEWWSWGAPYEKPKRYKLKLPWKSQTIVYNVYINVFVLYR